MLRTRRTFLHPPSGRVEGEVRAFGEGFRPTTGEEAVARTVSCATHPEEPFQVFSFCLTRTEPVKKRVTGCAMAVG
jgi:hypothetical protein